MKYELFVDDQLAAQGEINKEGMKQMPPIFSGKNSVDMWNAINSAKTIEDLRGALYIVGCRCQELEAIIDRPVPSPEHGLREAVEELQKLVKLWWENDDFTKNEVSPSSGEYQYIKGKLQIYELVVGKLDRILAAHPAQAKKAKRRKLIELISRLPDGFRIEIYPNGDIYEVESNIRVNSFKSLRSLQSYLESLPWEKP